MASEQKRERMRQAYGAAGTGVRARLQRAEPADAAVLEALQAHETVVVRGEYDHVEDVLTALGVRFARVEPHHIGRAALRPDQTVLVNCPGQLDRTGLDAVRGFVEAGGCLVTTDWALRHVLEPAFPGLVAYNDRPTRDDVVRVEIVARGAALLGGLLDPEDDPVWWLEGSSYPIRIGDPARVEVLIRSAELAAKYGEAPIAVSFRHGQGIVYHIVSHFYLQRTETRTRRQRASAETYFAGKGVGDAVGDVKGLELGEVETAFTSTAFLGTLLIDRKRAPRPDR